MPKIASFFNSNKFNIISWSVTIILVAGLVGGALIWRQSRSGGQAFAPQPTAVPDEDQPKMSMPALGGAEAFASIEREIQIKTNVPADKPRYDIVDYRVRRGDSIF